MPWWLAGMPPKTDKSKRQVYRSALHLHFAACTRLIVSCLSWVNTSLLWTVTPYQVDSVLFVLGEHLPTVNSYTLPGW